MAKFQIGELACPVQFTRCFPVHWRVKATVALNHVLDGLQALAVSNRRNTLVLTVDDHIFYLAFKIDCDSSHPARASDEAYEEGVLSPPQIPSPTLRKQTQLSLVSSLQFHTPTAGYKGTESCILMTVYGVDVFEEQKASGLINLVMSRLMSLTQTAISTFLSRNLSMKLTAPDVEFLLPTLTAPVHQEWICLPNAVNNIYLFLMCLRQSLSTYLISMSGQADVNLALRDHYARKCGWRAENEIS